MFTIILAWGKYSYLRLPMGFAGSADIFQAVMMDLMEALEYVRAYIDDLLVIIRGTLEDHLDKLREVLRRLHEAGLKVKIPWLRTNQRRDQTPTKKGTGNTCVKPSQQRERATTLPWHGTILP